jgi:DNA topoisomerase-2
MNTNAIDDNALFFDVQQKTDKQHILDNPDTYIGSVENVDSHMWIMNETNDRIIEKNISCIPGLFKLFDEGIVNCRDHVVRMQSKVDANVENSLPVTYIDITIQEDGTIVMTNDGNGIDVVQHPEYKTWVPELIFGHLRTSTNYNKEEKKIVGGKNGFGFKLVLIWSTYGTVETVDHIRGLKYTQEFRDNLDTICVPKITKASKAKPYTKITFKPDYQRLGINGLSEDMIALLKKRVYDISAVTDKTIKVKYNSSIIPTKNFEQYINLYIGDKSHSPRVYEQPNPRWEYAVALTPSNEFIQVSFVNGIYTSKGGKHVEYILNQITRKLVEFIEKKKKIKVNPNSIKEQLILFLRCDIENPAFDSQTKDFMNTPMAKFGSRCDVSDKFIEKVAKMGVMDAACAITEVKENKAAKKTDGTKSRTVKGIPKYEAANWAGSDRSSECTIIFCEGDSAKTAILSGLSSEDRDTIGVYPLKGKLMNVRGENIKKVNDNKEITEIKKILGLEASKEYKNIEDINKFLRYGKVVFVTDQDLDGSHIKGLGINLFQNEWASLTKISGFMGYMNTPILKAKKGNQELEFYNEGEYEEWKNNNQNGSKGWTIKYYKGLGTSTKSEFKEYFKKKKFVSFEYTGDMSDNTIDMVFNKKRSDDRKLWLENVYDRKSFADTKKLMIPYEEFINKELIHFSKYDCDRSIPNLMDGLKISLRKILFSSFKKRLTTEIKVAQFSGYVSEHSCYHHGETSLNETIVGMAQNFIGSNNINLLYPAGQFGSRLQGGKDHSSPRYIFTRLERITRLIFPEQDDNILKYLDDDGTPVEPQFYVPIIPMVLVNGSTGIGTGFSTEILCYNPRDIISYLKNKLQQLTNDNIEFFPYYEGFTGEITKINDSKFLFKGRYERTEQDKIRVTELPIGHWTANFKELLNDLQTDKDKDGKKIVPIIKDVYENYTDTTIDCVITFSKGKIDELEAIQLEQGYNGLEKLLKLYSTGSTTNMHLFDSEDKLKKYDAVEEIIDDYYDIRLEHYDSRREYLIDTLEKDIVELSNKAKYIQELLDGTIDLRKKKKQEIIDMLTEKDYDKMDGDTEDFKYLIKMPMDAVSEESVDKLLNELHKLEDELERIKSTTIEQMWLSELEFLENEYIEYRKEREQSQLGETTVDKKKSNNKTMKIVGGGKKVIKKVVPSLFAEETKGETQEEIIIVPKKKVVKSSKK